jgi:hypothetical protein
MKSVIDITDTLIACTLCNPVDEAEMQGIITYTEEILNKDTNTYNLLIDLTQGGQFSNNAVGMVRNFYATYGNRIGTMVLIVGNPGYAEVARILLERNQIPNVQIVNNKERAMSLLAS